MKHEIATVHVLDNKEEARCRLCNGGECVRVLNHAGVNIEVAEMTSSLHKPFISRAHAAEQRASSFVSRVDKRKIKALLLGAHRLKR